MTRGCSSQRTVHPNLAPGTYTLAGGDCLFMYRGGVTEAMNPDQALYSDGRLEEVLAPLAGAPPKTVVERVIESVTAYAASAPQADDIAAMAVRLPVTP